MSELYILFLSIALLLFLAIVGYSYWQLKQAEQPQKKSYVDPLFAELEDSKKSKGEESASPPTTKVEPSLDENQRSAVSKVSDSLPNDENLRADQATPVQNDSSPRIDSDQGTASTASTKTQPESDEPIAPRVFEFSEANQSSNTVTGKPITDSSSSIITELVARVKNPEPIEQQELLALFRDHDFKFHRKVHIYGLNQLTDLWRDIEFELPSARFVELGVAIQLADREGAMSKKELHDFQQMALDFSNKFDAPFEFSMDIDDAMKQAQILDQIGRRYDSMAVLNVVPRAKTGFRMADIESCARDLLMSTDKNGIFVKTKGQKHNLLSLYRLACTDGSGHFGITSGAITPVHDLVIYMNVPATPEPDRVFQEMVKDANNLATWLDGKVVDKNGRVMTQRSYTILMQQISDIAYSMQQDGLIPGDVVSKKLF